MREQYELDSDPATGAALDLLLTESLVRFGYHQRFGKVNPARMEPTWNFSRQFRPGREPLSTLQEVIAAPSLQAYVESWIGRSPLYRDLQKALVRLLSKSVALYGARLKPQVRSNSVHPTFVEGAMVEAMLVNVKSREAARERMTAGKGLGLPVGPVVDGVTLADPP